MPEISPLIDLVFRKTVGRLRYFRTFSPDIEVIPDSDLAIRCILQAELRSAGGRRLNFLDVGARDKARSYYAEGFDYYALDIMPQAEQVICGDICHCPIADAAFDVVFSTDVFEHLRRPWEAA